MAKDLPEFNQRVLAFFEGSNHHTGETIGFKREGWAFMVRWDDTDPYDVVADGWSRRHYDAALKVIDADYADIVRWVYVRDLPKIAHEVEKE